MYYAVRICTYLNHGEREKEIFLRALKWSAARSTGWSACIDKAFSKRAHRHTSHTETRTHFSSSIIFVRRHIEYHWLCAALRLAKMHTYQPQSKMTKEMYLLSASFPSLHGLFVDAETCTLVASSKLSFTWAALFVCIATKKYRHKYT